MHAGGCQISVSVQGGCLPAERGELACARDRDGAGRLAALGTEVGPAGVQTSLRAPGDLDRARVLAGLASREALTDRGAPAVVVGGLDQQPARVCRAGLGDLAPHALAV